MTRSNHGPNVLRRFWISLQQLTALPRRHLVSFMRKLVDSMLVNRLKRVAARHPILFTAAMGLTISGVILLGYLVRRSTVKTYYIAYVGRYQRQGFDELHERVLKKYLEKLNQDLHGVRFELRSFQTKIDADTNNSRPAYEEIARTPGIVLVVDNTWGIHLNAVADIVSKNSIPVISLNADKQNTDWQDQIVFIGYDDEVPAKVIAFHQKFLNGKQPATLIGEESFSSTDTFLKALPGVTALKVKTAKVNDQERTKLFSDLRANLEQTKADGARRTLILNTHAKWGNLILDFIREPGFDNIDILGGPFITDKKLSDVVLNGDNKLILFTHRRDAITKGVRDEMEIVKSKNSEQAALLNLELFIERSISAVAIIRDGATEALKHKAISRRAFLDRFSELKGLAIVSDGELYSFDDQLRLADERTFEQLFRSEWSSYPRQLNSHQDSIPNIYVGMDDICVNAIDTKNRSFHADFLYWLKYDDPAINPKTYLVFRNQKSGHEEPITLEKSPKEQGKEQGVYQLFKMSGDFELNVDLERYPFDKQEARIELAAIYPHDQLRVSFDHESFRRIEGAEAFSRTKDERCQVYGVDEWGVSQRYVTVDDVISSSLGGGSTIEARKLQKHELLNVRTPVLRRRTGPLITVVLPLWMIGLAAVGLLYVKDGSFANIGEICVLVFLTIVTYSIGLAPVIQRSNALTVADKLFFGTFLTVFLVFIKVVAFNTGVLPNRLQRWVNKRAIAIGTLALFIYSVMMILAMTGWDDFITVLVKG